MKSIVTFIMAIITRFRSFRPRKRGFDKANVHLELFTSSFMTFYRTRDRRMLQIHCFDVLSKRFGKRDKFEELVLLSTHVWLTEDTGVIE